MKEKEINYLKMQQKMGYLMLKNIIQLIQL